MGSFVRAFPVRRRVGLGMVLAGFVAVISAGGSAAAELRTSPEGKPAASAWPPGPSGRQLVDSDLKTVAPHNTAWASAACPSGKWIMGGGVSMSDYDGNVSVVNSAAGSYSTWYVLVSNNGNSPQTFLAQAVCGS